MPTVQLPGGLNSVTLEDGTTLTANEKHQSPVEDHLLHRALHWGCTLVEDVKKEADKVLHHQDASSPPDKQQDAPAVVKGQRDAAKDKDTSDATGLNQSDSGGSAVTDKPVP